MEKIYGYKQKDIIGLAEMIKNRSNQSLSKIFERYAIKSNKAKGTVRNLYYALIKLSHEDQNFCAQYLDGKPICAKPIIEFNVEDEKLLIKKVLSGKKEGRSVRSVIMEMAKGDAKLALRYQNKYRNAVKNKPKLVSDIIQEIKGDSNILLNGEKNLAVLDAQNGCSLNFSMNNIKKEIEGFIIKAVNKIQKENEQLRAKVCRLESENLKLTKLLYGDNKTASALKILHGGQDQSLPS